MELQKSAGRKRKRDLPKERGAILKFLIIVFPLWLSGKFYNGPYGDLVRHYLTAIVLIILLALLIQLAFPRAHGERVILGLFVLLSLVQIVFHFFPALPAALHFTLGSASFFGNGQSINTIPYYGVGGFVAFFVLKSCRKRQSSPIGSTIMRR